MSWTPKGRRPKRISTEKRVTSPLWATLVGGVLGITGGLGGAYLTTKATANLSFEQANRQSEKERAQLDDAAIRSLLTLAARSVAYANRAADQLSDNKDFQRDVPEPHEMLIDESMLFSPVLSSDAFALATKQAYLMGQAHKCGTAKYKFNLALTTRRSTDQLLKEMADCGQKLVAERSRLMVTHKRFREAVWSAAGRPVPQTP